MSKPPLRPPEPSRAAQTALRLAVVRFKQQERRRGFPPVVHVGIPGGREVDFVDLPQRGLDHALRTEVIAELVSRARTFVNWPIIWLTRPGSLDEHDADLAWFAPAQAAYGEAGVPLAMVVVTRAGWRNVSDGTRVEWSRLRSRSGSLAQRST